MRPCVLPVLVLVLCSACSSKSPPPPNNEIVPSRTLPSTTAKAPEEVATKTAPVKPADAQPPDVDLSAADVFVSWYTDGVEQDCLIYGRCGKGQPSKAYCASWFGCYIDGRCTFDPKLEACVATAKDCAPAGDLCTWHGKCDLKPLGDPDKGVMHCAASKESCRKAKACAENKVCGFDSDYGECKGFTASYCRRSQACKREGLCTSVGGGACQALLDADCRASQVCAEGKRCRAAAGQCVTTAKAIEIDIACRQAGKKDDQGVEGDAYRRVDFDLAGWALIEGQCRRTTSSRCKEACKAEGLCKLSLEPICTDDGVCSGAKAGQCQATKKGCKRAKACRESMRCAPGERSESYNKCSGYSEPFDDCTAAYEKAVCVLSSDGCKRDPSCRSEGHCSPVMVAGSLSCRPGSNKDCAQSAMCKSDGLCALSADVSFNGWCVPAKAAHCTQSTNCTKNKKGCTFEQGSCM